jgi:hypothetical protein
MTVVSSQDIHACRLRLDRNNASAGVEEKRGLQPKVRTDIEAQTAWPYESTVEPQLAPVTPERKRPLDGQS